MILFAGEDGVDERDVEWVQSACVLCSMDCGMDVAVKATG